MKVKFQKPASPFVEANATKAVIGGSLDNYGASSIETFSSASPLTYTHEDAQGWIDYVTQFRSGNFWFKDGGAQVWQYEETYDNWQDTYGVDAVNAFYHSGHGAMDSNGVFQLPLGAKWDNRDWAFSNRMSLGDEQVKYLFWSTCFGLRVYGANNPIRTWDSVNRGMRMIFGYETVSIDSPDYGKFFWQEWNKNKSFSTAWMDASWRIATNQVPTVCAMGATAAEAQSRVFNERNFFWEAASKNFYQWRWYYARNAAIAPLNAEQAALTVPRNLQIAEFEPTDNEAFVKRMANALGFDKKTMKNISIDKDGNHALNHQDFSLFVGKNGRFDAQLAKVNYNNDKQIDTGKAQKIAENLLSDQSINKGVNLKLADVRYANTCSGSTVGSGSIGKAHVTETTFEFRQVIDGLKVVNADAGVVRVTVDNDGKITNIHNSTRGIANLSTRSKSDVPVPKSKVMMKAALDTAGSLDAAFAEKLARIRSRSGEVTRDLSVDTIVQSELGYDLNGNHAKVVARRIYELEMGDGFKKMYKVQVPVFE